MSDKFHDEIAALKQEVLVLGALSRDMFTESLIALSKRDRTRASSVKAKKSELNAGVARLEDEIFQTIALFQPVARDMRVLICSLAMVSALERIGRYGKDIANLVLELPERPCAPEATSLFHMGDLVTGMIDDSLRAYGTEDLSHIAEHSGRDDTVDALRKTIFRESLTHMLEDPRNITPCASYGMIARYLERCADHSCKMAEKVHYMVTGERVEIK